MFLFVFRLIGRTPWSWSSIFCVPSRTENEIAQPKNRKPRKKFVHLCFWFDRIIADSEVDECLTIHKVEIKIEIWVSVG